MLEGQTFPGVPAMIMSKFRRRLLWSLAGALVLVCLALLLVLQRSERSGLFLQADRDLDTARTGYDNQEADDTRLLSLGLELLARDDALRNAYLARDRRRLQALAQPVYESLKTRYGITHFYFLDPPPASTCFLRVHDPELFGDVISRATYLDAVRGGVGSGKELGQTAFALRAVRAWTSRDGKRVVGYLELGEEIGQFLDRLKRQTGNDYALLLDKERLDPLVWMHMRHARGCSTTGATAPFTCWRTTPVPWRAASNGTGAWKNCRSRAGCWTWPGSTASASCRPCSR